MNKKLPLLVISDRFHELFRIKPIASITAPKGDVHIASIWESVPELRRYRFVFPHFTDVKTFVSECEQWQK